MSNRKKAKGIVMVSIWIAASIAGGVLFGWGWIPTYVLLIIASIDNGAVLAEKALQLQEEEVPLPGWLPSWAKKLFVGTSQREALPWIGLVISLPMKAGFAFFASALVVHHWILGIAGCYFLDLMIEAIWEKSFLKTPIIWVFRKLLGFAKKSKTNSPSEKSFWTVVLEIDLIMEAAYSIDEAILAASRLASPVAAAYGMVASTFSMRLLNVHFQKMISLRPILGMAVYIAIGWMGVEMLLGSFGFNLYEYYKIKSIEAFSSVMVILIVFLIAESIRIIKLFKQK